MKTCPAGHQYAFSLCLRCMDMIAASKVDLTQKKKETRGRPKGIAPVRPGPDEVGNRYGRLTVIKRHNLPGGYTGIVWLCLCDCGKEKTARGSELRRGNCKSCGCLQMEMLKRKHKPRARNPIILTEADKARCKRIADKMNAKALANMASQSVTDVIQAMRRRQA